MTNDQIQLLTGCFMKAVGDAEKFGREAAPAMRQGDAMVAVTFGKIAASSGLFALAMREALKQLKVTE